MQIAVAANKKYIMPAKIMLTSFLMNNKKERHQIHFMYTDADESNLSELKRYIESNFDAGISYHHIDDEKLRGGVYGHFTKEVYARYYICDIIPPSTDDKCIYLDCDIIVQGDLQSVYDSVSPDIYCVACLDYNQEHGVKLYREMKLSIEGYFNSGVIFLNLAKLRDDIPSEKYLEITKIAETADNFLYPDQDVLNILYGGSVKYISTEKFNKMIDENRYCTVAEYNNMLENVTIFHFSGPNKPWGVNYKNRLSNIWRYYAYKANKCSQRGDSLIFKVNYTDEIKYHCSKEYVVWKLRGTWRNIKSHLKKLIQR